MSRSSPLRALGALLMGLSIAGHACASGPDLPEDEFVSRRGTDIDPDLYDGGELGVLLPSYPRLYLYPAWRAIVLGREGLRAAPARGLRVILSSNVARGWYSNQSDAEDASAPAWEKASAPYADAKRGKPDVGIRQIDGAYNSYVVCQDDAFRFAVQTLRELAKRSDATPARLREWVRAQDQVFIICGRAKAPGATSRGADPARALGPLPAGEPAYWRGLREYQLASAAFYDEDFADSTRRFAAIGSDPRHPMHAWGAYLAMRSTARAADLDRWPRQARKAMQAEQAKLADLQRTPALYAQRMGALEANLEQRIAARRATQLGELSAQAQRILADPALAKVHEAARGTLRTMQARLAPAARLEELTGLLDNPALDPYNEDRLNDWRMLANDERVGFETRKEIATAYRQRYVYFDWMRSLQECSQAGANSGWDFFQGTQTATKQARERNAKARATCEREYQHAYALWQRTAKQAQPAAAGQTRAWLVAALLLANNLPAPLERAALAVPPDAPEYLTVRYHLARLCRRAGRAEQARALLDTELKAARLAGTGSPSAQNLFKQERFALARNTEEALGLLLRTPTAQASSNAPAPATDTPPPDKTAADKAAANAPTPASNPETRRLAGDGARWLNSGISTEELFAIAQDMRFTDILRNQLAVSAWLRADLTGQPALAVRAARLVAAQMPRFEAAADDYLRPGSIAERRHRLVLAMLSFDLHPDLPSSSLQDPDYAKPAKRQPPDQVTASMWCHITDGGGAWSWYADAAREVEQLPPALNLSTRPAARDREIGLLRAMPSATGFVGAHVLARARSHPRDADLPWLLYVTVWSTRGGCLDAGSAKLSRTAYTLLHQRFEDNEWAQATPYWYGRR